MWPHALTKRESAAGGRLPSAFSGSRARRSRKGGGERRYVRRGDLCIGEAVEQLPLEERAHPPHRLRRRTAVGAAQW